MGNRKKKDRGLSFKGSPREDRAARFAQLLTVEEQAVTQAKNNGQTLVRIWRTQYDGRTRKSHRRAEGQKVAVGEAFRVGAAQLGLPSDTTPQGDAGETFGCRCFVEYTAQETVQQLEALQQELKDRFNVVPLPRDFEDEGRQERADKIRSAFGRRQTTEEQLQVLSQLNTGLEQVDAVRQEVMEKRIQMLEPDDPELSELRRIKNRKLFKSNGIFVADQEPTDSDSLGQVSKLVIGSTSRGLVLSSRELTEKDFESTRKDSVTNVRFWAVGLEDNITEESIRAHTARHELGHALSRLVIPEAVSDRFTESGDSGWFGAQLGDYARRNEREAFAESFAWYTSPQYPHNIPHGAPGAKRRLPPDLEWAIEDVLVGSFIR